jgi:two-component system, chemotaxis family, chemotaxis protein CheY
MVVDDSPAMRAWVRRTLQLSGVQISEYLEAANGQEALIALRKAIESGAAPDVVFSDINMPVMNGEEFVRQMQADEGLKKYPVIIVSTDGSNGRVLRLRELGARGYITKPCAPELVRMKLEQVLGVANG